MHNSIWESYAGPILDFSVQPTKKNHVKIRGVATPKDAVSRNNRKYVADELHAAARTWLEAPITVNHARWDDPKSRKGTVNWMEYNKEEGNMEYVADVWDRDMVSELRLYRENPKLSKIRGVSIEAEYLSLKCPRCEKEFSTEEAWADHMTNTENIHDALKVPHGMYGRALSLVVAPEIPGVADTRLEVLAESMSQGFKSFDELIIQVINDKRKGKLNMNLNDKEEPKMNPPYIEPELLKEQVETKPPEPVASAVEPLKPIIIESKKLQPFIAETAVKMSLGEPFGGYDNFEACVKANSDKENPEAYCGKIKHETEETLLLKKNIQCLTGKLKEVIDRLNEPLMLPADDKSWIEEVASVKVGFVELKKNIEAIPKDDLAWKEMFASLPKDDLAWQQEITQLKETIIKLTEQITKQNTDFATLLTAADKNVKEYQISIKKEIDEKDAKITALTEQLEQKKAKDLKETEDLTTRLDNTENKLKGLAEHKGKNKDLAGSTGQVSSSKLPYEK
jgi:hypothetical protein